MKFIVTIHPNGHLALRPDHTEYKSLGPMTPEEAVAFKGHVHDQRQVHCVVIVGPISKIELRGRDWRRAGKTQTWKTRPGQYRIPLMYAPQRQGNEITPETTGYFHRAEDCPLVWLRENVGFDRKRIVRAIKAARGLPVRADEVTKRDGLPAGCHTLDLEALPKEDESKEDESKEDESKEALSSEVRPTVEREVPEILPGEQGPATLDDTFLAPGREEFDTQSQFTEVYNSRSEQGAGPTEDFFDLYADTDAGEIVRKDVINTGAGLFGTLWRTIVEKARHVQSTDDPFLRDDTLAEIRRRIVDSGFVIDFEALQKRTILELWAEGIVTNSASSRLNFAYDVIFRLQQEAHNEYGENKPPYKVAHLSFTSRDVPLKTSLCGAEWSADCPLPYLQVARFKRFGAPPFTPVCLTCCDALAHMDEKDLGAKAEQAQEQGRDCNCEQMRKFVRMSTFDPPEKRGPGDPDPAWLCAVHGNVKDELSEARSRLSHDEGMEILARKLWFYDVAKSCTPMALTDKDAEAWSDAMAIAETTMISTARDPNSDFVIEYDDLINVVTVEERKSGRMAALDPAHADSWSSEIGLGVEARKRVLLALCFDKFLHNPDVV